ncbi:MAG: hypothetical protein SVW02_03090 [Candidatus Nanohaloarchaea archaeon]|nr:hypothetical protein [Candidatus Nanohaloarchaea archaeon]
MSTSEAQGIVRDVIDESWSEYRSLMEDGTQHEIIVDEEGAYETTLAARRIEGRVTERLAAYDRDIALYGDDAAEKPEAADLAAIVDPLDGSMNQAQQVGPAGPVVAIAEGGDPCFDDVVGMGYLDIHSGAFVEAYRGEGAYRYSEYDGGEAGRGEPTTTTGVSSCDNLDHTSSLLADVFMLEGGSGVIGELWKIQKIEDSRCLIDMVKRVAVGENDIMATGDYCEASPGKQKTGEELAAGYRLLIEAGGAMIGPDGEEIGNKTIGMDEGRTFDLVVGAASRSLAEEVWERVASNIT